MTHDIAIIEAVEAALDLNVEDISTQEIEEAALAVLAAVTPLIEAAALERAAKVAEDYHTWADERVPSGDSKDKIAAVIRALKEQP